MGFFFILLLITQDFLNNLKESEIRPKNIFDEFLRLAKLDTETYFANSNREKIMCPACGVVGKHSFQKDSFDYSECPKCRTLYVNPRPIMDSFTNYYTNSPSSKFWATTFYLETAEVRRKKIWQPKAQLIKVIIDRQVIENFQIIDIGGGYGIFAEEMQKITDQDVIIIEPAPHLA